MTSALAQRCVEARQLAEAGDLAGAAVLFAEVLQSGDGHLRAQAALGLAVVLEDSGDADGARRADWAAIESGDPEYAPRAGYHLALACERAGDTAGAAEAWRLVVGFGNDTYLPPAYLALAQLADDEGDFESARDWWERVVATGDEQYAPVAAHDLAQRLLERGQAARAQTILAGVLRSMDRDGYAYARLAVTMGLAHLEQAIGAFTAALGAGAAPDVAPLAVELLARTLPLRGREDEAAEVWRHGLAEPTIADQVNARLRREFTVP
ncbi:MAG: tetratricopeptide repeat protein [Streptosporangiaceae bacterium]